MHFRLLLIPADPIESCLSASEWATSGPQIWARLRLLLPGPVGEWRGRWPLRACDRVQGLEPVRAGRLEGLSVARHRSSWGSSTDTGTGTAAQRGAFWPKSDGLAGTEEHVAAIRIRSGEPCRVRSSMTAVGSRRSWESTWMLRSRARSSRTRSDTTTLAPPTCQARQVREDLPTPRASPCRGNL